MDDLHRPSRAHRNTEKLKDHYIQPIRGLDLEVRHVCDHTQALRTLADFASGMTHRYGPMPAMIGHGVGVLQTRPSTIHPSQPPQSDATKLILRRSRRPVVITVGIHRCTAGGRISDLTSGNTGSLPSNVTRITAPKVSGR